MEIKKIPFGKLPFSKLYKDYISGNSEIDRFYHFPCHENNLFTKKSEQLEYNTDRNKISDFLTELNKKYTDEDAVFNNIEKLRDNGTLAVVTGQQLTMHGGPLYTIYKIISAISLANKLKHELNREVVPVFWLADEDHDFDEINHVSIPSGNNLKTVLYSSESKDNRVSELTLGQSIKDFNEEVFEILEGTDFSSKLQSVLVNFYKPGVSVQDAFAGWILKQFGHYGLVVCGSNNTVVKELTADILIESVVQSADIKKQVDYISSELEETGYHAQVQVYQSNLFFITEEGMREKISVNGNKWFTDNFEWTQAELTDQIKQNPERFSPNVFLRPILQDTILPTVAYVGGPGEVAYYAQMQPIYEAFHKKMPVIWPRHSVTIAETAISRIMGKLPFSLPEYNQRIEDLEKAYVKQTEKPDPEPVFEKWKGEIKAIEKGKSKFIDEIDASLGAAAGKATAIYFSELDKLKGKIYRSMKEQESVQLNRISKIKHNLFPENGLQERQVAYIYFMNKYGPGIWDKFYDLLYPEDPFTHKLVEL